MFLLRIGQKIVFPLMIIVSIVLIFVLKMGFIFLLIALLPSMAAYFVDEDSELTTFRTIFACNLAAVLPSITPVFIAGIKMKHYDIGSTIANPNVWLFIYGGAAVGWGMIYVGSYMANIILEIQYKFRAAALEKAQARLLEEWGDSIKPKTEDKGKKEIG